MVRFFLMEVSAAISAARSAKFYGLAHGYLQFFAAHAMPIKIDIKHDHLAWSLPNSRSTFPRMV